MSLTTLVVWITSDLLMLLILVRGVKNAMLRAYSPLYSYLGFLLAVALVRWVVALSLGTHSSLYRSVYYSPTYVLPLLQMWILWDIYWRIVGYSKTSWRELFRSVTIVGVVAAPVLWGVFSLEGGNFFHLYHSVALFIELAICLHICWKAVLAREEIDLGHNLKGILSGLSLMIGCQAVNFVSFVFAESPSQVFWFFVQFIYLLALIVFAYTLWDYAPISPLDPSYRHRLKKANRELYEIVRSVLVNRR